MNAHKVALIVTRILAIIIAGIGAFMCLVPALSVNISAHISKGESWHSAAVYIVAVLMAAIAAAMRPIALRHNDKSIGFACLVVMVLAFSFNLKNALTSATISRDSFADPRRAEMEKIAGLEREREIIAKILAKSSLKSSQSSSAELKAKLSAKESDPIFTRADRSNRCTNATIPESAAFCQERAGIMAEIAKAIVAEKHQERIAEINAELRAASTRPTKADPIVDNLSSILGIFVSVDDQLREYVGLGADLHTAVFVELLAMFGPAICIFGAGLLWPSARADARSEVKAEGEGQSRDDVPGEAEQEQAAPAMPARSKKGRSITVTPCMEAFFGGWIIEKKGASLGASELYDAYVDSCEGEPVSSNLFGRAATARFRKAEGRTNKYLGIALRRRRPRLAVVNE